MNRKICVITGTRAEYGLLRWVMQGIKDDHELTLQIIVTGMHLSEMKRRQCAQSRSSRADEVLSTLKPVFSREHPEFPTPGYSEVCGNSSLKY